LKIKVLMIGPASLGGISGLIRILLPVLGKSVSLRFLPTIQTRNPIEAGKVSIRNFFLAISQYIRFIIELIKFQPQIIHLHTSQGIGWMKDSVFVLISKFLGFKVVLHLHAADFDKFYARTPRLMQTYTRRLLSTADAVISVSETWRRTICQIAPPDHVYKFINCINVEDYKPHKNHRSTNGLLGLFLGAVGERKGIPELLDAVAHLKAIGSSFHMWIAGPEENKGDAVNASKRIIALGIDDMCELVGDVRQEKKDDFLEQADLFVLPSHHEGLPIAMLEGMAAGLAVVTTPVGGIPEIIVDGHNGYLVPPGDVDALADKLDILSKNRELCHKMGCLNRQIAKADLNVRNYVAQLVKLYGELLSKHKT
jgi:glycosyltransferase involved in cell wall biosynthesis